MYYKDKLSRMVLYQTVRDCPGIQAILAISSSLGTSMDHPRSLLRRCECSAVELVAGVHEVIILYGPQKSKYGSCVCPFTVCDHCCDPGTVSLRQSSLEREGELENLCNILLHTASVPFGEGGGGGERIFVVHTVVFKLCDIRGCMHSQANFVWLFFM